MMQSIDLTRLMALSPRVIEIVLAVALVVGIVVTPALSSNCRAETLDDAVKTACRGHVRQELAGYNCQIGVDFYRFNAPDNYPAPWRIKVQHPENGDLFGGVTFKVTVTGADGRHKRFPVPAKVSLFAPALVAKERIPRETALTSVMFAVDVRDITRDPESAIRNADDIGGQWNVRTLVAGEMLNQTDLAKIPAIRSGEQVAITIAGDGFLISAPGTAIEDGWLDGPIRVKASLSRSVLTAVVVDERTVCPTEFAHELKSKSSMNR